MLHLGCWIAILHCSLLLKAYSHLEGDINAQKQLLKASLFTIKFSDQQNLTKSMFYLGSRNKKDYGIL